MSVWETITYRSFLGNEMISTRDIDKNTIKIYPRRRLVWAKLIDSDHCCCALPRNFYWYIIDVTKRPQVTHKEVRHISQLALARGIDIIDNSTLAVDIMSLLKCFRDWTNLEILKLRISQFWIDCLFLEDSPFDLNDFRLLLRLKRIEFHMLPHVHADIIRQFAEQDIPGFERLDVPSERIIVFTRIGLHPDDFMVFEEFDLMDVDDVD